MAGKGSGRTKRKGGGSKTGAGRRRWSGWLAASVVVVLVLAVPVARWWIHRDEGNLVRDGLEVLEEQGCQACHRGLDGAWRWRADGRGPVSLEVIRDAILNGRAAADGFPAPMPPYSGRLEHAEWLAAQQAVGALTGLVGVPEDAELAAGHDVARDMGCFGCHGPLGAGGIGNPGSFAGEVPGWYGAAFRAAASGPGGVARVVRDGSRPSRVPVPGLKGPVLEMPAFGSRLDSTEMDVLVGYLQWLHENPPGE